MASGFSVQIKGAKQLASRLHDAGLIDRILRPGFEKATVIVEGAATENAHRVTGKLQGSLGSFIDGHGASLEAHIGPQPGMSQPAAYTIGDTQRWKTPRAGINRGDPTEYGLFEEQGTRLHPPHPFLEPALVDNLGHIEAVIEAEARAARI